MKNKLKEELVRLSTEIIAASDLHEIADLYEAAKGLYERLAVLKFIEEKLEDKEVEKNKNMMAAKFEKMANAVLRANSSVPENNPHEEDIMIPGMDTIRDMVSEMPGHRVMDDALAEFMGQPNFSKTDKELFEPEKLGGPEKKNSNPYPNYPSREIKVDLNNRLAFVKHLFGNSTEDYNRVISQLNTIDTEERSVAFIVNMVKPDYNNWEGKDDYETRFMALIQRRFS